MEKESQFFEPNHTTQQLFANMSSGFALNEVITDDTGKVINYIFHDINPAFEKLTGLKKENVIQKTVLEVLPQTENYWIEKFGDVALNGTSIEYTNYSRNLDKYYETKAYSPKKGFFIVLFNDVTEKTIIENKVKENEVQLQTTFDLTPASLFIVDAELNITKINKRALELGNTATEQVIGKKLGNSLTCINASKGCGNTTNCTSCQIREHINKSFKEKANCNEIEISHRFKDGSKYESKHFILSTSYLNNNNNNSLCLVSLQDISRLKKQEEELSNYQQLAQKKNEEYKKLNKELKEQNEELQTLEEELRSNNEELYIANEKLSSNQQLLNYALSTNNDGIFDWNIQTGTVFFDQRYYTMAGYAPNEFEASLENWSSRIHPEDQPLTKKALTEYLSKKTDKYDVQFRFKKKDKSWLWIRARIKVVEKENGTASRVIGTHSDISEQKKLEEILVNKNKEIEHLLFEYKEKNEEYETLNEELKQSNEELYFAKNIIEESESKFRHLFNNAHAALYRNDPKSGTVIECNKLLAEMLEYDSVEECKKLYHNSKHYKNAADREKILQKLDKNGEFKNELIEFITAKGNTIWIKTSGRINKQNGYLEGGAIDITHLIKTQSELKSNQYALKEANEEYEAINEELKQTNEELYNAKEIIEESEKQFKLLFENMDDGFALHEIITNTNGDPIDYKFIEVNKVFEQRVGLTREQIIGKTTLELFPKTEQNWIKRFASVALDETPAIFTDYSKELDRYYETRAYCPKKGFFAATFADITEQKKNEKNLKEAVKKAEENERLKSAFLANMSHEIRTPLNGISGFISLLSPDLSEERFLKYTEIIQKSNDQLLSIINDILDLSKIEAGTETLIKESFNINDTLNALYSEFSIQISNDKLNFDIIIDDINITLNTDKTKFIQIFSNLLSNANKFTETGTISFGYTIEDEQLVFFVSDTGIGIKEEAQNDIFEYFRQLDNSSTRVYGGTGIGLSLVKSYVNLMGGKLWLKSQLGKGSTFYFTIDDYKLTIPKTQTLIKTQKKANWKGKNILIVEDDIVCQTYLHEAIIGFSSNILTANDGLEALKLIKSNPNIDLVLLDIKMPNLDGYATITEIKKINPNIPVIAQTAFAFVNDLKKIKAAGFDAFIAKPVKLRKLTELIDGIFTKIQ